MLSDVSLEPYTAADYDYAYPRLVGSRLVGSLHLCSLLEFQESREAP